MTMVEVGCVKYLEEDEVGVGWIGDLEEEVMVCCHEVMEEGEVEVIWIRDMEESEILINQTEDMVE